MERSKRKEKEKVTIYFDKRAFEEQEKEEELKQEELDKKQKQEEAVKAVAGAVAFFVKPLMTMLIWNSILPGSFGVPAIGYLKALGLYILARLFIDKND